MKTCDTCKFWNEPESQANAGWGGQCDHPKMISEQKKNYNQAPEDDGTVVMAHDYYPAYLSTGPKFGCIHHQKKEVPIDVGLWVSKFSLLS